MHCLRLALVVKRLQKKYTQELAWKVMKNYIDYQFGYELLMLNGALTFVGLWLTAGRRAGKNA